MKIIFFDRVNDGHHWFYNSELMKCFINQNMEVFYVTKDINNKQTNYLKNDGIKVVRLNNLFAKKNGKIKNQFTLFFDYIRALRIAKKINGEVFINLYFDPFILQYLLLKSNIKIVNILHWYPNNKIKIFLLSILRSNKRDQIIVHTEDIKKKVNKVNNRITVNKISYPIKTISVDKNRNNLLRELKIPINISNNKLLLYFGGTRHDKGIDILLEALKFVNTNITILIIGKEEEFTQTYIKAKLNLLNDNIQYFLRLEYIPEEDVYKYFEISDVVVLPYRSYFNGESGVLTDAIQTGKPVIVPNIIHFPAIINTYNNGIVYKAENPIELAKSIDNLLANFEFYINNSKVARKQYIKDRDITSFFNKLLSYISS